MPFILSVAPLHATGAMFDPKVFADSRVFVVLVNGFDGLFNTHGDEQPHDDGCDMEEEVTPGAGGVTRRVNLDFKMM